MSNKDKKTLFGVIALNVCEILSLLLIVIPIIFLFRSIFTATDSTNVINLIKTIARDIFILACGAALFTMCMRIEKVKEAKILAEKKAKELEEKKAKKAGETTMGLGALAGLFGGMVGTSMPGMMGNMPPIDENGNSIIEGEVKQTEVEPVKEESTGDGMYINSIDELKDLINSNDSKAQEILEQVQKNLNKDK